MLASISVCSSTVVYCVTHAYSVQCSYRGASSFISTLDFQQYVAVRIANGDAGAGLEELRIRIFFINRSPCFAINSCSG
jgi:hypothetical protein